MHRCLIVVLQTAAPKMYLVSIGRQVIWFTNIPTQGNGQFGVKGNTEKVSFGLVIVNNDQKQRIE